MKKQNLQHYTNEVRGNSNYGHGTPNQTIFWTLMKSAQIYFEGQEAARKIKKYLIQGTPGYPRVPQDTPGYPRIPPGIPWGAQGYLGD